MNIAQLERAASLIKLAQFLGVKLEDAFRNCAEESAFYRGVQHLLDTQQFFTLLALKRAENHATLAFEGLTPTTEYLRQELEQHLSSLHTLLEKMEREEHLRRDRDALLSSDPTPEESKGIGEWTSGKTTG